MTSGVPGGTGRVRDLSEVALLLVGALATFIAVWSGGIWLTNDGPQHLFSSFAPLHLHDPALGYDRYFDSHIPPTSMGFRAVFTLFEPLFGWQIAYRLTCVFAAELWAVSFIALVRAVSPRRTLIGLLGFPTAFQLVFFLGFLPFLLGSALGMLALAAWRSLDKPVARVAVTALLLYFAARSHVVAAALAGLLLVALAIADERGGWRERALGVVLCGLPALVVLVQCQVSDLVAQLEVGAAGSAADALSLSDRVLHLFQVGPAFRGAGIWGLIALGVATSWNGTRTEKALAAAGSVFIVVAMVLPRDAFDWQMAGARPMPLGVMAVLAVIAVERLGRRTAIAVRVVVVLYAAASLTWAWSKATEMRESNAPVIEPLATLTPNPRLFAPYILDPCLGPCDDEIPGYAPGFRLGQLYAVVLGGESSMGHLGVPSVHHLVQKAGVEVIPPPRGEYALVRDPAQRAAMVRKLATWMTQQDAVLIVGNASELAVFEALGFVPELNTGTVLLATFEGCRGRVSAPAGAGRVARVGAWPQKTAAAEVVLDGSGAAQVEHVPCDDVWLTVDGLSCAGTAVGMPVRATWRRGADNALTCLAAP